MVISIETTMNHPKRGFIKLEDTVAVTDDGHQGFGDGARGWNRAGDCDVAREDLTLHPGLTRSIPMIAKQFAIRFRPERMGAG